MPQPEKWTEEKAAELGRDLIAWYKKDKKNLLFEDYLVEERGLYPEIVSYLLRKFPKSEFASCIRQAKKIQEIRIVKGGLDKSLDKTMAIFMAKVHHGYRENEGIMGSGMDFEPDSDSGMTERPTEDLLKDIKKRLGKG